MENITDVLNNFTLEQYMPTLDTLSGWVQGLVSIAVRVGPICILVLGLIHLWFPPNEANRRFGFRTYFGMGSTTAWHFTQRISGILMTLSGIVLTVIAFLFAAGLSEMDLMTMGQKSFSVILSQAICVLVIHVFMFVLTAVLFDRKGVCRFQVDTQKGLGKLLFDEKPFRKAPAATPVAQEQPAQEETFEQQGQQVITAHDIVIEDLE